MKNPIVTVDFRKHPLYSSADYYSFLCDIFKAEILTLNTNKGTMRVRLFHTETDELITKNLDCSTEFIVEDEIVIKL